MPTRPSQNDPKRVVAWQRRRRQVGTRIQALRIDRDLTQEQLAQLSGVSRNVLMDVEHGRRGILHERLFDIAKALGVSAADLLEGMNVSAALEVTLVRQADGAFGTGLDTATLA